MTGFDSERAHIERQRELGAERARRFRYRQQNYRGGYRCLPRLLSAETESKLAQMFPDIAEVRADDDELALKLDALEAALAHGTLHLWRQR